MTGILNYRSICWIFKGRQYNSYYQDVEQYSVVTGILTSENFPSYLNARYLYLSHSAMRHLYNTKCLEHVIRVTPQILRKKKTE